MHPLSQYCSRPMHSPTPSITQAVSKVLPPARYTKMGLLFSHLVNKPLPTCHPLPLLPSGVTEGGSHWPLPTGWQAFSFGAIHVPATCPMPWGFAGWLGQSYLSMCNSAVIMQGSPGLGGVLDGSRI